MTTLTTSGTVGTVTTSTAHGCYIDPAWTVPPWSNGTNYLTYDSTTLNNLTLTPMQTNKVQQNHVVVFKVTRNEDNEIISAEFIKEMWVETKNGSSVEFEVARDKDLAKYKATELSIRTICSITF